MLHGCVRLSVVAVCNLLCIVAERCVLEQKLLLTAYIGSRIWGIYWYQSEWPLPLFIGRLRDVNHCVIFAIETVRDRGLASCLLCMQHLEEDDWCGLHLHKIPVKCVVTGLYQIYAASQSSGRRRSLAEMKPHHAVCEPRSFTLLFMRSAKLIKCLFV